MAEDVLINATMNHTTMLLLITDPGRRELLLQMWAELGLGLYMLRLEGEHAQVRRTELGLGLLQSEEEQA
jgi:hypothetical protein